MPRQYKTSGYKHRQYEDVARILGTSESWAGIYAQLVNLFGADNPRFDADRFKRAVLQHSQSAGIERPSLT